MSLVITDFKISQINIHLPLIFQVHALIIARVTAFNII